MVSRLILYGGTSCHGHAKYKNKRKIYIDFKRCNVYIQSHVGMIIVGKWDPVGKNVVWSDDYINKRIIIMDNNLGMLVERTHGIHMASDTELLFSAHFPEMSEVVQYY